MNKRKLVAMGLFLVIAFVPVTAMTAEPPPPGCPPALQRC